MGTQGHGLPLRAVVEFLSAQTGLDMMHVPCKSAGPVPVELLGGKIAFALVGTRGCFHISRPERFVRWP